MTTGNFNSPSYIGISKSKDVDQRAKRYLINMSIRMVCLLLMLVVPGWWKLVFFIGAAFLPMVAVMFANDQAIAKPLNTAELLDSGRILTANDFLQLQAADLEPLVHEPLNKNSDEVASE